MLQKNREAIELLLTQGPNLDLDRSKALKKTAREEIISRFPDMVAALPPPWSKDMLCNIKMDAEKLFQILRDGYEERQVSSASND